MCSGKLLACCYFEELKIDCAIHQLKPGLKSKVNAAIFFFCYLKSAFVENAPVGRSTTSVHFAYYTQGSVAAPILILKYKVLQCKIILLCRLHKYKNVIMDSHCQLAKVDSDTP